MSGHGAQVENGIWMRAVMMGGIILTIGVLLFATLGVAMADVKHDTWEELEDDYHHEEVEYALDGNITAAEAESLDTFTMKKLEPTSRICRTVFLELPYF